MEKEEIVKLPFLLVANRGRKRVRDVKSKWGDYELLVVIPLPEESSQE